MKTVVRITNDYNSTGAYQEWKDEIEYFVNDVFRLEVCVSNKNYINTCEELKKYSFNRETTKKTTTVIARGYSQSEWQEYTIHHNEDDNCAEFKSFIEALKRTFTHKNDYCVEKFERAEIDGKTFDAEPHDHTSFSITHIEFPDKEDVKREYVDIYGEDFDEIEINID